MDESSTFTVEYVLSEEELASFLSELVARARFYRWLPLFRRFGLAVLFLAGAVFISVAGEETEWWQDWHVRFRAAAAFGGLIFCLSIVDPFIASWLFRRRMHQSKYLRLLRPVRVDIAPNGVRLYDKLSGKSQNWPSIRSVQRARAGIVLRLAPNTAVLMPHRIFDGDAAFVYFRNAVNRLGSSPG